MKVSPLKNPATNQQLSDLFCFKSLINLKPRRPHQGSLPQGRGVRLLLQRGLGRDAHQPADTEAPRGAEQVRAEAAGKEFQPSPGAAPSAPTWQP